MSDTSSDAEYHDSSTVPYGLTDAEIHHESRESHGSPDHESSVLSNAMGMHAQLLLPASVTYGVNGATLVTSVYQYTISHHHTDPSAHPRPPVHVSTG
jgi:hypothetical protein